MAAPLPSSLDDEKSLLRRALRRSRPAASHAANRALSARLARLIAAGGYRRIAAVWPLPGEVDLRPLCRTLYRAGYGVVLPETTPPGQALRFRTWNPEVKMRPGRFGTLHPAGPIAKPDLVLVPFLAFDRSGSRLGYGGGYYDRTLKALAVPAIGFGLAAQERETLPAGPYDQRLAVIVTEKEIIRNR